MTFDPRLCVQVFGDRAIRLQTGGSSVTAPGAAPQVTVSTVTVGSVTTATATAGGENAAAADLANARWRISPSAAGYAKQQLFGRQAVWKHTGSAAGSSAVTVYVPRLDGGPDITVDLTVPYVFTGVSGLFPKTTVTGGETIKVEDGIGFANPRTCTTRLLRTSSPGQATERALIEERTVTFPAGQGVTLSRDVTFPAASGLGAGYEYVWEVDLGQGQTVRSGPLPVWVLGSDPSCKPQPLAKAPTSIDYPAVYTRPAEQTPRLAPTTGKTYAEHLAKFLYDWKANNLSAPVGGAWLSFNDYNANIYWVDIDDASIPKYTLRHWDVWGWGYTPAGWYGDGGSNPFPRNKVAVDVPIPNNAAPSIGTDRSLCIVGLRNGKVERIWEMWLAQKMSDGQWRAASVGVTTAADEWRHSKGYTVAAVGISALAYALRVTEAKAAVDYVRAERAAGRKPVDAEIVKRVPHALSINQPNPYAGQVSYPGTFSDGGSTDPATAWEGQLVYLRQDAPIDAQNYPPLHHVIAVVGKYRGFRVTDRTSWSTTTIVEGDQSYGGGLWDTIRDPGESWKVIYPDDWFVLGKQYPNKAAFDADTGVTPVTTTMPFTDRENVSFTGAGQTSKFHAYASGMAAGAGLVVWLHGDAAFEFNNPSSTYIMGGTNGVRAACKARNVILVSALAPDTTGTATWWEDGMKKADYLKALLDAVKAGYGTKTGRVCLAGFSGGAQQTTQFFMRAYPEYFATGGLTVAMGGGEAPDVTPTYSTTVKSALAMHWAAGENDTAANAPDGFDGLGSAQYGQQWFAGQGFTRTTMQVVAGKPHDIGIQGTVLAQQLDKYLSA